jgi:hypothetical protein
VLCEVLFFVTLVDVCLLLDAVFLECFLVGLVGAMVDALATEATNRNETRTATTERLAFLLSVKENRRRLPVGGSGGRVHFDWAIFITL